MTVFVFVCVAVVIVCARSNVCVSFVSCRMTLHGLFVLCVAVCWCMSFDVFVCFVCGSCEKRMGCVLLIGGVGLCVLAALD